MKVLFRLQPTSVTREQPAAEIQKSSHCQTLHACRSDHSSCDIVFRAARLSSTPLRRQLLTTVCAAVAIVLTIDVQSDCSNTSGSMCSYSYRIDHGSSVRRQQHVWQQSSRICSNSFPSRAPSNLVEQQMPVAPTSYYHLGVRRKLPACSAQLKAVTLHRCLGIARASSSVKGFGFLSSCPTVSEVRYVTVLSGSFKLIHSTVDQHRCQVGLATSNKPAEPHLAYNVRSIFQDSGHSH